EQASQGCVIDVTDDDFDIAVVERSRAVPVLVDFWAPWCGPCRMLGPVLERVAADMGGRLQVARLNVDENPTTAARFQVHGIRSEQASQGCVIDVTDDDFDIAVVERSRAVPVLVDFWAPWCGPCRMLGPVLERVAADMGGRLQVARLNVDENPTTAARFQVHGI